MKERENPKFLQSYVHRDNGDVFFVSTGYRQSSAMLNPDSWYYETFAWRLKQGTHEREEWVADHSGAYFEKQAIKQHFAVVEQLQATGGFSDEMTS